MGDREGKGGTVQERQAHIQTGAKEAISDTLTQASEGPPSHSASCPFHSGLCLQARAFPGSSPAEASEMGFSASTLRYFLSPKGLVFPGKLRATGGCHKTLPVLPLPSAAGQGRWRKRGQPGRLTAGNVDPHQIHHPGPLGRDLKIILNLRLTRTGSLPRTGHTWCPLMCF